MATPTDAGDVESTPLGWWRSSPLALHIAALAAALLVGLWLSVPGVAFTSDEGAALLQAEVLDGTGGWIHEYPLVGIDPEGEAQPFLRGDRGSEGLAPYAKHPLYPVLLLVAGWGGTAGVALTAVAGTLVAAVAAALLARRLDPTLDRWALWACGVASPLFFDAYLVLGHTLAAAAAGLSVLAALNAVERDRIRASIGPLVAVALAVAVATALRTEGAFVGPALAIGVAAAWWRRALPRATAGATAVVALASTGAVVVAERVAIAAIVGDRLAGEADPSPSSWLAGRIEGIVATWLDPSYGDDREILLLLALAAVLVAFVSISARLAPSARGLIVGGSLLAVGCYAVRLVLDPPGAVPGLVIAFPVGWAAVWQLRRSAVATPAARLVSVAAATVVVLVVLTQYARGGGLEWGGRYFAVALPLAVPPLVAALAVAGRRLDRTTGRVALGCLVAASLLVAALGLRTVRHVHQQTDGVLDAVAAAAAEVGDQPGVDRPVVVSWNRLLPQIAYRDFDDYEWVVPRREQIAGYLDRLAGLGVEQIVFVTPDSTRDLSELPGWTATGRTATGLPLEVLVLERTPGSAAGDPSPGES